MSFYIIKRIWGLPLTMIASARKRQTQSSSAVATFSGFAFATDLLSSVFPFTSLVQKYVVSKSKKLVRKTHGYLNNFASSFSCKAGLVQKSLSNFSSNTRFLSNKKKVVGQTFFILSHWIKIASYKSFMAILGFYFMF